MHREELEDVNDGAFKACCDIFFLKTSVSIKPRTVSFRAYPNLLIKQPEWCPLKPENRNKPKVHDITNVMSENSKKKEPEKAKSLEETAKEFAQRLARRTAWETIKVGAEYVIPRIDLKPCKVVRVVEKSENIVKMKEVDSNGIVTSYSNVVYKDDIEAKLMAPHKIF